MKKRLQIIAWLTAVCLVAGGGGLTASALADGLTYVWVGMQLDGGDTALLGAAASTITVTGVDINGLAPATDPAATPVWFSAGDGVAIHYDDTIADNEYTYDVSIDGGVTYLSQGLAAGFTLGDLGLTAQSTPYAMAFRVNDADDAANSAVSQVYYVYYDDVAPVLLCKAATDNTLVFFAGDSLSGFSDDATVNNVTFTASSTVDWVAKLTDQGQNVFTYSVQYTGEGTIPAGTLAVRDAAGNMAVWGEDITITATAGEGGGMSGGGSYSGSSGGGGSSSSRTVYYASSTYDTVTPYNGVNLVVGNGAMQTLVIGDQTLNLTLTMNGNGPAGNDEDSPFFSASFTDWNGDAGEVTDAEDEDAAVDTLVLTAADAAETDGEYCWTFDGSVYKKLAASGIDYLMLTVGDQATALSTAGFTAGLRYNMYRAAGIASKSFVYTITMGDSGVKVQVDVDGESYTLTDDQTSEFYYYDLYSGSVDMLNQPFGQGSDIQISASEGRND